MNSSRSPSGSPSALRFSARRLSESASAVVTSSSRRSASETVISCGSQVPRGCHSAFLCHVRFSGQGAPGLCSNTVVLTRAARTAWVRHSGPLEFIIKRSACLTSVALTRVDVDASVVITSSVSFLHSAVCSCPDMIQHGELRRLGILQCNRSTKFTGLQSKMFTVSHESDEVPKIARGVCLFSQGITGNIVIRPIFAELSKDRLRGQLKNPR